MKILRNIVETIGKTPLIYLHKPSQESGCSILGKAEFLNPGGSVKDRPALFIIKEAQRQKLIAKGGTVIEATAGNTGIGLAIVSQVYGYKTIIVTPDNISQEKKDLLRMYGASLKQTAAVPYKNPKNYVKLAHRLAQETKNANGVLWANQFDNIANRLSHLRTTGPEIWRACKGRIDAFTCSVGTGGTLSGVSAYLKKMNPDIKIVLADPMGSALYNYYANGELKSEGNSITEGIGQSRITKNLDGATVDDQVQVNDAEALNIIYSVLENQGILLGGSSGINIAGAMKLAKKLGKGHVIVTILCDGGERYRSKLFNREFLLQKKLPLPPWMERECQ